MTRKQLRSIVVLVALTACKAHVTGPTSAATAQQGAQEHLPTADQYGDPIPRGSLARMGTVRLRHGRRVNGVAFSPAGNVIATGGEDGTIRLWETATGRQLQVMYVQPEMQDDMSVLQWRQERLRQGTIPAPRFLAFSPDGKTLLSDNRVELWDTATGRRKGKLSEVRAGQVTFSPDGKLIASAHQTFGGFGELAIRIWDAHTGQLTRRLRGHDAPIHGVWFSGDSKSLTSMSSDRTVRIWDVESGAETKKYRLPYEKIRFPAVAVTLDGKTLAISPNEDVAGGLLLMNLESGETSVVDHRADPKAIAFTPDGRYIASSYSRGPLWLWDTTTNKRKKLDIGADGPFDAIAFSRDGRWLALSAGWVGHDHIVHVFRLPALEKVHNVPGHEGGVSTVGFSPDNRLLATGSNDGQIQIWEARTGRHVRALKGHLEQLYSLSYSPSRNLIASGGDDGTYEEGSKTVRIWDATTGKMVRELPTRNAPLSVAISPDGAILAAAVNGGRPLSPGRHPAAVSLWNLATGRLLRRLVGHRDQIYALAFSPDGKLIASLGGDRAPDDYELARMSDEERPDAAIRIWTVDTGEPVALLKGHQGFGETLAFAPDGRTLASAGKGTSIRIWSLETSRQIQQLELPSQRVSEYASRVGGLGAIRFSRDGKHLFSGGEALRVWDLASGRLIRVIDSPQEWMRPLALSPDGQFLATGGADCTALVWSVQHLLTERR